jgi:EAL domain-containing protein (putative c-di-GMP-specific phosphodiesterase class I)
VVRPQRANGMLRPEDEIAQAYRDGHALHEQEDVFTRKDGSMLPVAYSASPLTDGDVVQGAVVVFRDVSEQRPELQSPRQDPRARSWVRNIRQALDEGRFELFAQPIVPLRGGPPREELLLRMKSREGRTISASEFLPVAEKYGLIGAIDRWVVSQAIELAADGRRVEVNLSASSVGDREMLSLIDTQLHETGADPAQVVFEITETALIHEIDAGEAFARDLTELGCELALDDFGTGFGSFTYLKRLPISYLKIDIEFVRQLPFSSANQHLVKAIVNLAQGFGQETIAEGVEDEPTLALLRRYGVDYAQGFHLGHPAPTRGNGRPAVSGSGTRAGR